ncbi:beta-ketoacyl-ACP synthase III [Sorangium sp. So ce388]|uniref:beta-ketoacyl-ACP synthase III n=1 Tax=Sorangium sp. So ce388 TaxID=3133309 RepID=UPI003F5B8B89
MDRSVYITSTGAFLPGKPVPNEEMEQYIGKINDRRSRLGRLVLRQNGIKTRHYALTPDGVHLHSSADMAARAIRDALSRSEIAAERLSFLAAATTQGDLLVPGFASAVHGELGLRPMEIASFQSVCASSMMAFKSVYLQLRTGEHDCGVACAAELSSRFFRPGFYAGREQEGEDSSALMDTEFLRWTLSDGAGAWLLETRPNEGRRSLRVEWIDLCSYADRFDPCMYAGTARNRAGERKPWSHYDSPALAAQQGAVVLKQDFELLYRMFPVWAKHYLELLDRRQLRPGAIDHFLAHYSSHSLRGEMVKLLAKTGAMVPEARWFTNLYSQGNTGAASILLMLHQLLEERDLQPGQQVLGFIPESGRCVIAFMLLTVV